MRRERPHPAKKWLGAPVRCDRTPEATVSDVILSSLKRIMDACEEKPEEFGYVVVARVVDRSRTQYLQRCDVDAEALASFLPIRDEVRDALAREP